MKKIVLYIAVSLDGYIADLNGSVDWIKGQDEAVEPEDTFTPFFDSIDTVIMGKRTYDQIVTELSPNHWPYMGATTFVITHNDSYTDTDCIRFRNTSVCNLVDELRQQPGKNIWICGGAQIARQLIEKDMIDIYHIAVIPVILGGGIKLFDTAEHKIDLALAGTKEYNGIIELTYNRKQLTLPFSDAPNTAVFICSHILDCGEEILFVSHDADDGAWQFLCRKEHDESDARIVSLNYVFNLDPTIGNLKDLPPGYCAERKSKNDKWVILRN